MSTPEAARGIPGGEVLIALGGDLYAARPDGTARRHLAERVTGADWSPDGRRIAYTTYASGVSTIYTMTAAGTQKKQVTAGTRYDEHPTGSPDGTRLAYQSCAVDFSSCSVAIVRAAAPFGKPKVLLAGRVNPTRGACAGASSDAYLGPKWHPHLNRLALQHACRYDDAPSKVLPLVVSAGTGQSVTAVAGRLRFPDWSPDGGRLVWQDARDVEGAAAIIRTDPQGGHRKQITPLDGPGDFPNGADLPVFSPDGRWVLYEKRYADMWITDINGTSTRLVLRGARPLDWKG